MEIINEKNPQIVVVTEKENIICIDVYTSDNILKTICVEGKIIKPLK